MNRVTENAKIVQGKTFIPTNNYDLSYLKQWKSNLSLSLLVKSSKYDRWKPIQISESPILFTLNDPLRSRLNTFTWFIRRNIWKIKYNKTFKIMIHYTIIIQFSIFVQRRRKNASYAPPSLLHSTNKKFVYRSFVFYIRVNRWP